MCGRLKKSSARNTCAGHSWGSSVLITMGTAAPQSSWDAMLGLKRINQIWTPEEDEQLLSLSARNVPQYRIAHTLGRTSSAVSTRLKILVQRQKLTMPMDATSDDI